jgi:hypothetical protein
MKKFLSISIAISLFLLLLSNFACSNELDEIADETWQLAGYVDVKTGEFTEEETSQWSKDYNILRIKKDGSGKIHVILNWLEVDLINKPFARQSTMADDSMEGHLTIFYNALHTVSSFEVRGNKLKLYYNEKRNYLLYKRQI